MNEHVFNIARTCYFELRCLALIRGFLTRAASATLVSAFALSRIDHCDSLLFVSIHDVTSHFHRIQNYAARVILCLPKSSNIIAHVKSLHWLPVNVRSTSKWPVCATSVTLAFEHPICFNRLSQIMSTVRQDLREGYLFQKSNALTAKCYFILSAHGTEQTPITSVFPSGTH